MTIWTIATVKLLSMKTDSKYFHNLETVGLWWAQVLLLLKLAIVL